MVTAMPAVPSPLRHSGYNALMIRFVLLFLALLVGLFTLSLLPWGQRWFVEPFTAGLASVCTWLVALFDAQVTTWDNIIQSTRNGFAIEIMAGCNGVEAMIVLASAVLAFPSSWRHKLLGLGLGFVAIQTLNVVRIISLFYLGQWSLTAFQWFHLYIWQALLILDALLVWLIWLKYAPRRPERAMA